MNRCDCETGICEGRLGEGSTPAAKASGHVAGSCPRPAPHRVRVFGFIQNLCDVCLQVARENYPNDVETIQ